METFEPLVELIKVKKGLSLTLPPGNSGITLKMCLDAIISFYALTKGYQV